MSSGALYFALCPLLWHLHACKQWKVSGKKGCPVWTGVPGGSDPSECTCPVSYFTCTFVIYVNNFRSKKTLFLFTPNEILGEWVFPRVNLQQGGADPGTLWAQGRRWWERQKPSVWGGPHSPASVSFRLPLAGASSEIGIFFSWKLPVSLPSHNVKKFH